MTTKELPASVGTSLLDINRTSIYYKGSPVSDDELVCKEIIDHLHTDNPTWGTRQMSAQLKARGYRVGRRKARRYMNEMDIHPIYPKMNLSKRMQQAKACPYLLRNAVIDKPNQAWSIDITYIPIKHGFLYLTAVIDWYSRCIVGWEVDDTLDTRMVINALNKAFKIAKPQVLNSDQGCQFTSQQYIDFVKENGIRQSMDGKSRWADNIMIERWFRSFKYEEAYLTQYNNIKEARAAIKQYVHTYNFERYHSALDYLYHQSILTLNSIMFLLILRQKIIPILIVLFFKFHYVSINSDDGVATTKELPYFKFHYVSINSDESSETYGALAIFKFHYVSINSLSANCAPFELSLL